MIKSRWQYFYSLLITTVLLTIAALVVAPMSYGQSTAATITGTVLDQTGAAVPDVKIALTNINTNLRRQVTTNDQGYFVLPQLEPGKYKLQAFREGFALVDVPEIVLNASDRRDIQIRLKVSRASETVTVAASAITVNTSDATVSTVVDRQFVQNLPLNGRSFQPLILLTPGVVQTAASGGNVGQFSVNGMRSNANSFQVDGVSANAGVVAFAGGGASTAIGQQLSGATPGVTAFGGTGSMVSVDALEEFKIQTSTYSAQFGRQPGAQVQLVTRSGTNTFHGTIFNYFRNDVFDARDYFLRPPLEKPPLRMNDFGGTFGGPIFKNKTFFFFSYEGLRLREPDGEIWWVPSLEARQTANPAFRDLLNAYPIPTGPEEVPGSGWAPFQASYSNPMTMNSYSLRIDHSIGNKVTLFGRYNETPSEAMTRRLSVLMGDKDMSRSLTLGATAILTPHVSNEVRANYTKSQGQMHRSLDDFAGAVPVDESVLLWGNTGYGTRLGTFTYQIPGQSAASLIAGDFVDLYQRQLNIVDNVAWSKGSHELKFGVDYRRLTPTYGPSAYYGTVSVRTLAYLTAASPLVNTNITAKREARPLYTNLSLYAQDTWKITPRLTLDYGLRWEFNPPPEDATGIVPPILGGITGDLFSGYDTANAYIDQDTKSLYKTFYKGFAPRVGVAYQLNQSNGRETVVRGGFGVFYDLGSGQTLNGFTSTYPFTTLKMGTRVPFPLSAENSAPNPLPEAPWHATTSANFFLVDQNLKLPYTLQWNVTVEQSLGNSQTISVGYVGSAGRRLLTRARLNGIGDISGVRPNPNFAGLIIATNGPTSDYHSMQVKYQRRLSRGLQALANYTWSHSIDTVSDEISYGSLLRGSSDFDVRHNVSAALSYELPKLRNTGPLDKPVALFVKNLVNGWSIDAMLYAQSGTPFDVTAGTLTLDDGTDLTIRPDLVPGEPLWTEDSTVAGGKRLNPAAFLLPDKDADGNFLRQGTMSRNLITNPFVWENAISLGRRFDLTERWKLQFRADIFNPFNHPTFGDRDASLASCTGAARTCTALLNDTSLGVPDKTLADSLGMLSKQFQMGGNRSMQFSLKLTF